MLIHLSALHESLLGRRPKLSWNVVLLVLWTVAANFPQGRRPCRAHSLLGRSSTTGWFQSNLNLFSNVARLCIERWKCRSDGVIFWNEWLFSSRPQKSERKFSDAGLYLSVVYRLRWAAVVGLFSCVATVCWLCISLPLMLKLRAPVLFCIKQQHLTMVTRGTV